MNYAEIVAAYNGGESGRSIATRAGVSHEAIYRHLRVALACGEVSPRTGTRLRLGSERGNVIGDPLRNQAILDAVAGGSTFALAAQKCGVTRNTVAGVVRRARLQTRAA